MTDDKQRGLIAMVLDEMNPTVKAVLFGALALPVFLALSGMMLQVNVGKLIEEAIEAYSIEQSAQRDIQTATLLEAIRDEVSDLSDRVTIIRKDVDVLKNWACDYDKEMCQ